MSANRSTVAVVAVVSLALGVLAAYGWNQAQGEVEASVPTASAPVGPTTTASPTATPLEPSPTASVETFDMDQHSTDEATSLWVVVNKARPLDPVTYEPAGLQPLAFMPGGEDQYMTAEAAAALAALHEQLQADGLELRVATGYRSHAYQGELFDEYVAVWGRAHAESLVARPGHTEHQTGLAVDLFTTEACRVKECFAEEEAYAWLVAHAADYGFIERYPAGRQAETGYRFEPWHWRYVGTDLAAQMKVEGVAVLEEFLGLPAAPDYLD